MKPARPLARLAAGIAGSAALIALGMGTVATSANAQQQSAPPSVTVETVTEEVVGQKAEFVGRVQAINTVQLVARVEGFLDKINFQEGSVVQKGQLLFLIEQAPYKAALDNANAQLASANAALAKAEKPRSGERVFSLSIYVYTHHEHERVCLNDNFSKGVRRRSLLFLSFAVKVSAEWPVLAALRSAPRLIPSVFRACPVVRPRPAVRPSRCGR